MLQIEQETGEESFSANLQDLYPFMSKLSLASAGIWCHKLFGMCSELDSFSANLQSANWILAKSPLRVGAAAPLRQIEPNGLRGIGRIR